MTNRELEEFVREKAKLFITSSLKGRYSKHVSDKFIEVYLVDRFMFESKKFAGRKDCPEQFENIAYDAACPLFESYLEHGCQAGGNGHHVAQDFCSMFK